MAPSSSGCTEATSVSWRTSTSWLSRSVNRVAISSSSLRSNRSERLTRVTAVPRAEKTWANSAAT